MIQLQLQKDSKRIDNVHAILLNVPTAGQCHADSCAACQSGWLLHMFLCEKYFMLHVMLLQAMKT